MKRTSKRDSGFTLLEVLISMLIGTIGLLGTIAVQQAIINASKNANDAAVAMRLASQKIEELTSMCADTQAADMLVGLGRLAPPPGALPAWKPTDATANPVPEYVDAEGLYLRDANGYAILPQPGEMGRYRWRRQWKVANTGTLLPYVISVIVTYDNDAGQAKTTRLDLERRKSW
jgi:prepilin-type N-terminal cleavage/methylation domain-containing protein